MSKAQLIEQKPAPPNWQTLPEPLRRRVVAQLVPLLVRQIRQRGQVKEPQPSQEGSDE